MLFGKGRQPDRDKDGGQVLFKGLIAELLTAEEVQIDPRYERLWDMQNSLHLAKRETELIEEAVDLARERAKLRDKIIGLSCEDPRFLEALQAVLDRLGL